MSNLSDFLTPVSTGLRPAPPVAGRLSPKREADLLARLRALAVARAQASVASRSYLVGGGGRG